MNEGYLVDSDGVKYYPRPSFHVGCILESAVSIDPSKIYGGIWEEYGVGRVVVGVDTSQAEFNEVKKIGGSKDIQKHTHVVQKTNEGTTYITDGYIMTGGYNKTGTVAIDYSGMGNSGNLQPYITAYRYVRIA
jgi:hypothetical protein